jgi:short-subunit dehydrogenase
MASMKNIVITGASSGLGAALALEYATSGVTLGLLGRNADRLESVAAQCRTKGANVVAGIIDVTDNAAIGIWLKEFDRNHAIDLCIANAGISAGTGGNGESLEQIHRIFDINITGVINTLHAVASEMTMRGYGQLAIVSSLAGFRGSPTAPAYSASKAAVRIYGQALQGSLAPHGVSVSVICPGFIKTPMTEVNPFPMPFIMAGDKAARIIKEGLARRKTLIAFPLPMLLLAKLQNFLPNAWVNRLYRSVPAKPPN